MSIVPATKFQPSVGDERIEWRVRGNDIQTVEFRMEEGAEIIAQPGVFLCGAGGVKGIGITFGKSLMAPIYRTWSGEKAVLQELAAEGQPAQVVIGAPQMGRIIHVPLRGDRTIIAQRGAFLASAGDIELKVAFTSRLRAGLFGGQGVVFQRISGVGDVFLHALGVDVDWTLEPGSIVRVSTNNILAFDDSVGYDVQFSGGLMAMMLGGQGAFLSQLEGPGRVIVQSVDHDAFMEMTGKMSDKLKKRIKDLQNEDQER